MSCCNTPACPSTLSFSSLLMPTARPKLFLILIPKLVVFSASLRITLAAVITVSDVVPGITKFRACSEIPLNCGTPSPPTLALDKLIPGRMPSSNPSIADFGINASLETIAIGLPSTSINTTSYVLLSPAITCAGLDPVAKPSANSGPTRIHPEPANKYNCWLSVSTHKSPITLLAASGAIFAFLRPPAATQVVPSHNFSWSVPTVLSYHN